VPLLTPEDLQEIRQIIEDHHDAFSVNTIGPETVPPDVLARLQDAGLVDVQVESIKDAYVYGQLLAMMQSEKIANMSYAEFKQHLRRNPVPLSAAEIHAIQMAQQNAGMYCRGLGNRVSNATGGILIEADARLRARTEGIIRDATAFNIARRETISQLRSDLGWATGDWKRDWHRIAVTEKQNAMQQGVADHYRSEYGGDVLVAKRAMPDACKHCKRLHNGPDGQPRIFKLRDLENNGTNVGRRAADWLPVVGTVHPNCQCQLIRVPEGWGFDEDGDLVPGGELGRVYEGPDDVLLSIRAEDDLQKAFKLQSQVVFQDIPIAIENKAGTIRRWKDAEGNSGETKMLVGYGYIKRTNGIDEDEVDVFVGPDPRAEMVYVIEQQIPQTGLYDEQKCMLGFGSQSDAEQMYQAHFNRLDFALYTTAMTVEHFKRWLQFSGKSKGEMFKAKPEDRHLRLVIPLAKKSLDPMIGAATSQAGNRNVVGAGPNYIFHEMPRKPKPQSLKDVGYRPDSRELQEHFFQDFEAENPLKRDREVYEFPEHQRFVRPIEMPDDWEEAAEEAREGHEDRMAYLVDERIRNAGRPKNMAELAKALRRPIRKE
jgi:hypothetical protein